MIRCLWYKLFAQCLVSATRNWPGYLADPSSTAVPKPNSGLSYFVENLPKVLRSVLNANQIKSNRGSLCLSVYGGYERCVKTFHRRTLMIPLSMVHRGSSSRIVVIISKVNRMKRSAVWIMRRFVVLLKGTAARRPHSASDSTLDIALCMCLIESEMVLLLCMNWREVVFIFKLYGIPMKLNLCACSVKEIRAIAAWRLCWKRMIVLVI